MLPLENKLFRESSFNMTREGGMKILTGGTPKIFRHPKGGALKKFVYFKTNRRRVS